VSATPSSADASLTLAASHEALARVVKRLYDLNRSTRSAAVKPALLAETGYRFNEADFKYDTFREYLRSAERAGVVVLRRASTGPDYDVLPASRSGAAGAATFLAPHSDASPPSTVSGPGPIPTGGDAAAEPAAVSRSRPAEPRIREDLWNTSVDWSDGWVRYYDRVSGFAFRLPEVVTRTDPIEYQLWMNAVNAEASEPNRFVPIEFIDQPTTLGWIREFIAELPAGEERDQLTDALSDARPIRSFTQCIRALRRHKQWADFRVERVRDFILAWSAKHGLAVDLYRMPEPDPATLPAPRPPLTRLPHEVRSDATPPDKVMTHRVAGDRVREHGPVPAAGVDVAALREWVHALVDRMTTTELLSLPVTLDVLWRR
jgi:hypothetical protein